MSAQKCDHRQTTFALLAGVIADRFGIKLVIDWENSFLDFQGELEYEKWDELIGEIEKLAERMGIENGETMCCPTRSEVMS